MAWEKRSKRICFHDKVSKYGSTTQGFVGKRPNVYPFLLLQVDQLRIPLESSLDGPGVVKVVLTRS